MKRPVIPAEHRVDDSGSPYRYRCDACDCDYIVNARAMMDETITGEAFRVWPHYHMHVTGPEHHPRTVRRPNWDPDEGRSTTYLKPQDLYEAMIWWDGFTHGRAVAAQAFLDATSIAITKVSAELGIEPRNSP